MASKFTSDACPITRYPCSQTGIGDCRIASPIYFRVSPRYLIGSGCEFHPPVYVQVCKNVCTYIYFPNPCRQVNLPASSLAPIPCSKSPLSTLVKAFVTHWHAEIMWTKVLIEPWVSTRPQSNMENWKHHVENPSRFSVTSGPFMGSILST